MDFPLGHTAGPPNRPELQDRILEEALVLLEQGVPESLQRSDVRWPGGDQWKVRLLAEQRGEVTAVDDRAVRSGEPRYQHPEDAEAYEAEWLRTGFCASCVSTDPAAEEPWAQSESTPH